MSKLLLRERHGDVEVLKLNRPDQHNCVNDDLAGLLRDAFNELENDDAVAVVVVTGAGDSFTSGLDLKQLAEMGPPQIPKVVFEDTGWCGIGKRHFPKPLIAAVNGLALAGGLELALSCDFIYASDRASFGCNETTLGPIADAGACFRLPRWVPLPFAREMLFTGRRIDAREAKEVGLVNRIVPHEQLMEVVLTVAKRIAANSSSSMRITKSLINKTQSLHEDDAWVINDRYMLESFDTHDFMEGPRAFAGKRKAAFNG